MRCLTLANELSALGMECIFVTRENPCHALHAIVSNGHKVVALAGGTETPYGPHPAPPTHAIWLGTAWRDDACATRKVLEETGAAWLIVDHYAIDQSWHEQATLQGVQLLVLDDLADRPHLADILVDQNAGREVADYNGLLPDDCELRIGPAHAILRPEFARLRSYVLARRTTVNRPEKLLITLGGIDKNDASGAVLDALAKAPEASHMTITVVMGATAPHLNSVRMRAASMPMPTEVVVGITNMAERMLHADLCIGAAGSTAWERCALGLPTLQVVLADNQFDAALSMAAQGLSLALPPPDAHDFPTALSAGLEQLSEIDAYRAMARSTAAQTDARGAARLAQTLKKRIQHHAD